MRQVVIALSKTWFSIWPGSEKVVTAWEAVPTTYHQLAQAEMADLKSHGIEHLYIPAGPGDILIFKKFTVHGSVAVKAGDETRFATYAHFQLSRRE